jgi:hypothetical protein
MFVQSLVDFSYNDRLWRPELLEPLKPPKLNSVKVQVLRQSIVPSM